MIEVEIKVKISDPDKIREEFNRKNGTYKCSLAHEDTYLNMPEGLRDFTQSDEALRIRKSLEFDKRDAKAKQKLRYYLTYKGSKLNSDTKTRKELESSVEDGEKVLETFRLLGFKEVFTVKKERELYTFEWKNTEIEALIDYIPLLNEYFIEIESQVEKPEDAGKVQDILFEFLSEFGIDKGRSITKSYLELITEHIDN